MDQPDQMTERPEINTETPLPAATPEARTATAGSHAASLLMGVKLPIRILLGRTQLALRDVAQLAGGSIVELDCSPDDPVDILVNDRVIAHGEVVVVGGFYGVRITRIAAREEKTESVAQENDLLNLSERLK